MIVRRKSPLTGQINEMDLDISNEQIDKYHAGAHIQDAFPQLNAQEREFIISGCTADDWEKLFGGDEEE